MCVPLISITMQEKARCCYREAYKIISNSDELYAFKNLDTSKKICVNLYDSTFSPNTIMNAYSIIFLRNLKAELTSREEDDQLKIISDSLEFQKIDISNNRILLNLDSKCRGSHQAVTVLLSNVVWDNSIYISALIYPIGNFTMESLIYYDGPYMLFSLRFDFDCNLLNTHTIIANW